jgi:hypothetical protein
MLKLHHWIVHNCISMPFKQGDMHICSFPTGIDLARAEEQQLNSIQKWMDRSIK